MERSGGRLGNSNSAAGGGHMMSHHSGSGLAQSSGESGSGTSPHQHHAVYSHA
jgi:hypothetical protein